MLALVASLRSQPIAGHAQIQLLPAPTGQVAPGNLTLVIKSQHRRLPFAQDIQRLAVGDTEILTAELINNREVLV